VTEPEASPTQVSVTLTREGRSGEALIGWSLQGSGVNAAQVTNQDVAQMQGTVVMPSGE